MKLCLEKDNIDNELVIVFRKEVKPRECWRMQGSHCTSTAMTCIMSRFGHEDEIYGNVAHEIAIF